MFLSMEFCTRRSLIFWLKMKTTQRYFFLYYFFDFWWTWRFFCRSMTPSLWTVLLLITLDCPSSLLRKSTTDQHWSWEWSFCPKREMSSWRSNFACWTRLRLEEAKKDQKGFPTPLNWHLNTRPTLWRLLEVINFEYLCGGKELNFKLFKIHNFPTPCACVLGWVNLPKIPVHHL